MSWHPGTTCSCLCGPWSQSVSGSQAVGTWWRWLEHTNATTLSSLSSGQHFRLSLSLVTQGRGSSGVRSSWLILGGLPGCLGELGPGQGLSPAPCSEAGHLVLLQSWRQLLSCAGVSKASVTAPWEAFVWPLGREGTSHPDDCLIDSGATLSGPLPAQAPHTPLQALCPSSAPLSWPPACGTDLSGPRGQCSDVGAWACATRLFILRGPGPEEREVTGVQGMKLGEGG